MDVLAGPYAALALLVVLGGLPKAWRPLPTVRALRSVGLPARVASPLVVRGFGLGEAVLGTVALVVGGAVPALLLAVSYAGFAAFVLLAMARGGSVSSCGCFGRPDTPPTAAHVVVDAAAALVALAVAIDPAPAPVAALGDLPWAGVPLVALVGVTAWLGYLALAELPRVTAAMRGDAAGGTRPGARRGSEQRVSAT